MKCLMFMYLRQISMRVDLRETNHEYSTFTGVSRLH
jgi:hypothetical protein